MIRVLIYLSLTCWAATLAETYARRDVFAESANIVLTRLAQVTR